MFAGASAASPLSSGWSPVRSSLPRSSSAKSLLMVSPRCSAARNSSQRRGGAAACLMNILRAATARPALHMICDLADDGNSTGAAVETVPHPAPRQCGPTLVTKLVVVSAQKTGRLSVIGPGLCWAEAGRRGLFRDRAMPLRILPTICLRRRSRSAKPVSGTHGWPMSSDFECQVRGGLGCSVPLRRRRCFWRPLAPRPMP